MRVTECSAIQADAKEVGYVSAGAKCSGRRGPFYENEEFLLEAIWAHVRVGYAVPDGGNGTGVYSYRKRRFLGSSKDVSRPACRWHWRRCAWGEFR